MEHAAAELMEGVPLEPAPLVDLVEDGRSKWRIAATSAVFACHHSYRQVTERVSAHGEAAREITDLGMPPPQPA